MQQQLRIVIGTLIMMAIFFFTNDVIQDSKLRRKLVYEQAEIKSIRHGLLDPYEWKEQISGVLAQKIRSFNISGGKRDDLRIKIESSMTILLEQLEEIIENKKKDGGLVQNLGSWMIESMFFDIQDLKGKIPEFTEVVLDEVDRPENRVKLQEYIDKKLAQFLEESVGRKKDESLQYLEWKYECNDIPACGEILKERIAEQNSMIWTKVIYILVMAFVLFFVLFLWNQDVKRYQFILAVATLITLLIGAIKTPMMDIDARIDHFEFLLLGTNLVFDDQLLFFQSKSIYEVVLVLMKTSDYQAIFVGLLIFLFSIIFPILKLVTSIVLFFNPTRRKNKFMYYMALKSGKWSMADVFVVAIFMSYIGFRSIVKSQLGRIAALSERIIINTADFSNIGIGFSLFLAFVVGSMVLSSVLKYHFDRSVVEEEKEE